MDATLYIRWKPLGWHSLHLNEKVKMAHLCPTLCDPMDCSPPGFSVHGILQARILEWVAIPFSRRSSQPRDWTRIFCIAGRFFTVWDTKGRRNSPQSSLLQYLFLIHTLSVSRGADFSIQSVRNELCKDICCSSGVYRFNQNLLSAEKGSVTSLIKNSYLQNEADSFHYTRLFFSSHSEMSRKGLFGEDRITFNCDCFMQGLHIRGWIEGRIRAHCWPRTTFVSFHSFLWMKNKLLSIHLYLLLF